MKFQGTLIAAANLERSKRTAGETAKRMGVPLESVRQFIERAE